MENGTTNTTTTTTVRASGASGASGDNPRPGAETAGQSVRTARIRTLVDTLERAANEMRAAEQAAMNALIATTASDARYLVGAEEPDTMLEDRIAEALRSATTDVRNAQARGGRILAYLTH